MKELDFECIAPLISSWNAWAEAELAKQWNHIATDRLNRSQDIRSQRRTKATYSAEWERDDHEERTDSIIDDYPAVWEVITAALSENRIVGAGLDVFTYEPLPPESPLCALDNVILCPHIGGGTGTNRVIELGAALEEMSRVLSG